MTAKAVFLSYASEDAGAAKNICDALRVAGIEVWFDQTELRGGDAWDQKIRQQIRDCALFVPIISAHTQARPEGYFRFEWKLAVDRTYLMAAEKAFLVPVVVDATTEPEALVPAQFREVQWTRIQTGEVQVAFVDRIATLLNKPVAPSVGRLARAVNRTPAKRLPIALIALSFAAVAALVVATAVRGGWFWKKPVPTLEASTASTSMATTPTAIPDKSVAVLPFIDMSEKKDQEYFSDGLSEELIDMLTKVPDLRVPARTSSFYFKGKQATISEISKALGVAHVLEGSVRKAGKTLRVTAQLIRADNGYHLWSETYNREVSDVFKLQDEIAEAVVGVLKVKLLVRPSLEGSRGTKSLAAYSEFLLGRQFMNRRRLDDLRRAVDAYSKATELDPTYAAAFAELVIAQVYLSDLTDDELGRNKAEATADRAVELAPERAEGYSARGWLRTVLKWDWAGADSDLRKATALDPSDSVALNRLCNLRADLGRLQEAIACARKVIELDPLAAKNWSDLSDMYAALGDYAAARAAANRALEIQPEDPFVLIHRAEIELLESRPAEALKFYRQVDPEGLRLMGTAMAEHALSHGVASDAALGILIEKYANSAAFQIALIYAWRGNNAVALDWLERAYRQRDGGLEGVKTDALLRSIRGERRYQALLRKMGLPE
ncbi:MAG TPA: TIR domain-containing protein [Steroidobacteraceae bacterium]|nr:TIR domain-containing protein [Steroidobacteraceae bacterium]